MTKLKTLNKIKGTFIDQGTGYKCIVCGETELIKNKCPQCGDEWIDKEYFESELKDEAIKWVKELQAKQVTYRCDNADDYVDMSWMGGDSTQPCCDAWEQCEGTIGFIIKFFNLTLEDLK